MGQKLAGLRIRIFLTDTVPFFFHFLIGARLKTHLKCKYLANEYITREKKKYFCISVQFEKVKLNCSNDIYNFHDTYDGKYSIVQICGVKYYIFVTSLDLNKCLKEIILPISLDTCAPISELPSYISTTM